MTDNVPARENFPLLPGERLDALGRNGLGIIQNPSLFQFTTDSYLLAAFARPRPGVDLLELGSGNGAVMLLLAARTQAGRITGLEIRADLADMARRSIAGNGLAGRAEVITHDIRYDACLTPSCFGMIVANPPYLPPSSGLLSPAEAVAQAKHELTCSLRDVVRAAARWSAPKGSFVLVHRPERLPEIFTVLNAENLTPKELALVYPSPDKPPGQVLILAKTHAKPGLSGHPPLCIRDRTGAFTAEMEEVFAGRWPFDGRCS